MALASSAGNNNKPSMGSYASVRSRYAGAVARLCARGKRAASQKSRAQMIKSLLQGISTTTSKDNSASPSSRNPADGGALPGYLCHHGEQPTIQGLLVSMLLYRMGHIAMETLVTIMSTAIESLPPPAHHVDTGLGLLGWYMHTSCYDILPTTIC